jgi:hypothetical protein
MLLGDLDTVADPVACRLDGRPLLGQFRLPAGTQGVKNLRPGFEARPLDDPRKLRPEVRVLLPVQGDDVGLSGLGFGVGVEQVGARLAEQGGSAGWLCPRYALGRVHEDPLIRRFY